MNRHEKGTIAPKDKFAAAKVHEGASGVEAQYEQAIREAGRPLICDITLSDVFTDSAGCFELSVHELKKTVSFMVNDRTISYKTLTHALKSDSARYGLSCGSDGNCELYELVRDRKARTRLISSIRPAKRVIDPMLAFQSGSFLYVVFNIPTQAAIDRGVKGRKPVFCDDGSVAASGAPYMARFDVKSGEVSYVSPRISVMPYYVCALADDPSGSMPELVIANVLAGDEAKEETHPSLHELWEKFFGEGAQGKPSVKRRVPIGVSVLRTQEKTKYIPIPMEGDMSYGIESVTISPSPHAELNEINFLVKIDEDVAVEIAEIADVMAVAEENLKVPEAPCSGEMENAEKEGSDFAGDNLDRETLESELRYDNMASTADVSCDDSVTEPQENGKPLD